MTTRGFTYIPNPGFEEEWLSSDDALELVGGLADQGADIAKSIAPERQGFIKDKIEATAGVVDGVATGRINSHDFKSWWHEAGTRHHGPTPFLRPAAEAVTGSEIRDRPGG